MRAWRERSDLEIPLNRGPRESIRGLNQQRAPSQLGHLAPGRQR